MIIWWHSTFSPVDPGYFLSAPVCIFFLTYFIVSSFFIVVWWSFTLSPMNPGYILWALVCFTVIKCWTLDANSFCALIFAIFFWNICYTSQMAPKSASKTPSQSRLSKKPKCILFSKIFYFFDAYACSAHLQNFDQGHCSSMYFWTIYINLTFIAPLTGRKLTCRCMLFFTMNLITFLILAHPLLSRLVNDKMTVVNTYVFIICND